MASDIRQSIPPQGLSLHHRVRCPVVLRFLSLLSSPRPREGWEGQSDSPHIWLFQMKQRYPWGHGHDTREWMMQGLREGPQRPLPQAVLMVSQRSR